MNLGRKEKGGTTALAARSASPQGVAFHTSTDSAPAERIANLNLTLFPSRPSGGRRSTWAHMVEEKIHVNRHGSIDIRSASGAHGVGVSLAAAAAAAVPLSTAVPEALAEAAAPSGPPVALLNALKAALSQELTERVAAYEAGLAEIDSLCLEKLAARRAIDNVRSLVELFEGEHSTVAETLRETLEGEGR